MWNVVGSVRLWKHRAGVIGWIIWKWIIASTASYSRTIGLCRFCLHHLRIICVFRMPGLIRTPFFPIAQEFNHLGMVECVGLIDGHIAPAIFWVKWYVALLQQELYALQMAFARRKMQCRSTVVVRQSDVHSGQFVSSQRGHIAASRRKEQIHNGQTFRLIPMAARIFLIVGMFQVVVAMEIEIFHQFLEREITEYACE